MSFLKKHVTIIKKKLQKQGKLEEVLENEEKYKNCSKNVLTLAFFRDIIEIAFE